MVQQRLCLACNKPFEVPGGSKRKYCSSSCWPPQPQHSRKALPDVTLKCPECGQKFQRKGWLARKQAKLGWTSYCSTDCRDVARRGTKGEERVERIVLKCAGCGEPFEVPPHLRHRKCCSRQCAGKIGGRRPGERKQSYISNQGYVMVYVPPEKRPPWQLKKPHQGQHRVAMAEMLGRWPEPHESVHHINGDRADNRPENLQLRSGPHGKGGVLRCRACGSNDIEHVELGA